MAQSPRVTPGVRRKLFVRKVVRLCLAVGSLLILLPPILELSPMLVPVVSGWGIQLGIIGFALFAVAAIINEQMA